MIRVELRAGLWVFLLGDAAEKAWVSQNVTLEPYQWPDDKSFAVDSGLGADLVLQMRDAGFEVRAFDRSCEVCHKHVPTSPFRDKGKSWNDVCGRCKVIITLTPERLAKLQAEYSAVGRALEHHGDGKPN